MLGFLPLRSKFQGVHLNTGNTVSKIRTLCRKFDSRFLSTGQLSSNSQDSRYEWEYSVYVYFFYPFIEPNVSVLVHIIGTIVWSIDLFGLNSANFFLSVYELYPLDLRS